MVRTSTAFGFAVSITVAAGAAGAAEWALRASNELSSIMNQAQWKPLTATNPTRTRTAHKTMSWARGPLRNLQTTNRINNHGWMSDTDYEHACHAEDRADPVLQIIGDSFVEAREVPYPASCGGRAARLLDGKTRAYATGYGGASLAQYIRFAEIGRDNYQPHWTVFLIVRNDIHESRRELYEDGLHYQWERSNTGTLIRRPPRSKDPWSWIPNWIRKSALARYMFFNSGGRTLYAAIRDNQNETRRNEKNRGFRKEGKIDRETVDTFLERLPEATALPPERIAVILTQNTPHWQDGKPIEADTNSRWSRARRRLQEQGRKAGLVVVDLDGRLREEQQRRGESMDLLPLDGHWKPWAHRICAEAIAGLDWFTDRER